MTEKLDDVHVLGEVTKRRLQVLRSPIIYLIGTLYAGVVAGAFLSSISEMRTISLIIEKMAYLGFSFVFFINATSLILFYVYLLAPIESDPRDFALTATITFVFVIAYIITFLILPRGSMTYSIGMIGLGLVYFLAWIKYQLIFKQFRKRVKRYLSKDFVEVSGFEVKKTLEKYSFILTLKRNVGRSAQAATTSLSLGLIILVGRLHSAEFSENESWILSTGVALFALYMVFTVIMNIWAILNPKALETFEESGNEFFDEYKK